MNLNEFHKQLADAPLSFRRRLRDYLRHPTERNACYITGYVVALKDMCLFKTEDAASYWLALISRTWGEGALGCDLIAEMDNPPAGVDNPPAGGAQKGVVAWARLVYARPVNAPEPAEEWDEVVDIEFHNRPEKPEGEGWRPLVLADTGDGAAPHSRRGTAMTDRQTTHAPGCWSWGPRHYECAVGQVERDEALLRQALEALEVGRDYAFETAERFHIEMRGYKQQRHDAMDADVKQIDSAIAALKQRLGEQP